MTEEELSILKKVCGEGFYPGFQTVLPSEVGTVPDDDYRHLIRTMHMAELVRTVLSSEQERASD